MEIYRGFDSKNKTNFDIITTGLLFLVKQLTLFILPVMAFENKKN